jgi:NitT/TauT family transport system ATP-binding protein
MKYLRGFCIQKRDLKHGLRELDWMYRELRIQAENINFSYGVGESKVDVLNNVSMSCHDGEFVSLLGPSGCGKTTLLNMIAGTIKPVEGKILIDGEEVSGTSPKLAYVYQKDVVLPWFTVSKNLGLGMKWRKVPKEEKKERTNWLLDVGNFQRFASKYPDQLSGGMRRKLALLMALGVKPEILLLDEPFSALDQYTKAKMHAQVLKIWEAVRGTWLMVTHDIEEAITLSDRIIVMSQRPSSIKKIFDITIARPRDPFHMRGTNAYLDTYREVWALFEEELSATAATTQSLGTASA